MLRRVLYNDRIKKYAHAINEFAAFQEQPRQIDCVEKLGRHDTLTTIVARGQVIHLLNCMSAEENAQQISSKHSTITCVCYLFQSAKRHLILTSAKNEPLFDFDVKKLQ